MRFSNRKFSKIYLVLTLMVVITVQSISTLKKNSLNAQSSNIAINHTTSHDNIDDSSDSHSHTHKHSDDEPEHEHHHQHTNISQSQLSTLYIFKNTEIVFLDNKSTSSFTEDTLTSDPHYADIFRPPIV